MREARFPILNSYYEACHNANLTLLHCSDTLLVQLTPTFVLPT